MKTKIVYVLVSDESDYYYEQLLISACSLRRWNADAVVEVVADEDTVRAVLGEGRALHRYIDRVVVADVPKEYSKMQRSRWIKTRLRRLVEGDYLFVDTDTVICDSLAECDDFEHDLCAVRNKNYFDSLSAKDEVSFRWASSIGKEKELIGEPYFNSGVMYVREVQSAYMLYDAWHEQWQESRMLGLDRDQVALALANKKLGHPIRYIEDKWNCQIKANGIKYTADAKILHYFVCMGDMLYPLSSESVYRTIRLHDSLPPYVMEMIASPKKAWMQTDGIAQWLGMESIAKVQMQYPDFYRHLQEEAEAFLQQKKSERSENQKELTLIVVRKNEDDEHVEKCVCSIGDDERVEVLVVADFDAVADRLMNARGRYVKVVDACDWMDSAAMSSFVDKLRGECADVVLTDYCVRTKDGDDKVVTMKDVEDGQRVKMLLGEEAPAVKFVWYPVETVVYRTEMLKVLLRDVPGQRFLSYQEWEFYPLFRTEDFVYHKIGFYHRCMGEQKEKMSYEHLLMRAESLVNVAKRMLTYYVEKDRTFVSAGIEIMLWARLKRIFFSLMGMLVSMRNNERAVELLEELNKILDQEPKLQKETREAVFGSM